MVTTSTGPGGVPPASSGVAHPAGGGASFEAAAAAGLVLTGRVRRGVAVVPDDGTALRSGLPLPADDLAAVGCFAVVFFGAAFFAVVFFAVAFLGAAFDFGVAFSLAFTSDARMPEAGFFTCQHHFPENFWRLEYQRHQNGAMRLDARDRKSGRGR